jgi:EAL domain-containing protein (putative c-di-GMP-specific phosphodiesterase class I)/CheY-like chemotaxis protein
MLAQEIMQNLLRCDNNVSKVITGPFLLCITQYISKLDINLLRSKTIRSISCQFYMMRLELNILFDEVDHADPRRANTAGRLLLLDDDPDVGATIALMADLAGFDVCVTQNGWDFCDQLDRFQPTHICIDLVMPDFDGIEMLRILHDRGCTAGLFISSGVEVRVLEAAGRMAEELGLNIVSVLTKPFSAIRFKELLLQPLSLHGAATSGAQAGATTLCMAELKQAIDQRQFYLVYQPKVDCASGALRGFEALVRWRHPDGRVIPPDDFLPMLEQSDLIHDLTDLIVDKALGWLRQAGFDAPISLAINISARSFNDIRFADRIHAACARHDIDPTRIILEITETSAMENPTVGLALMTRLCMKGFTLSIDDFGVGYSSMIQLARLPFSELKIDRTFVVKLPNDFEARTIVESSIKLCHSLGMSVTAEGVETLDAFRFLQANGCDLVQGYFIARPMDATAAMSWRALALL